MKFCQSCGMPLQAEDQWGTSAGKNCLISAKACSPH